MTYNLRFITHKKTKKTLNSQLSTLSPQPGLTLVELIVGFAVAGIIAILIAALYFAHFKLFSNQNTAIEVDTQNKIALEEITNQIRESQQIVTTCTNCNGDTTSSTVLVLQIWPLDATGEPFDPSGSAYDYIVYKQDPSDYTKLIKKIVADAGSSRQSSEKIIASMISNLNFTYNNPDVTQATEVTIEITTTDTSINKTHSRTQSSKAVLRNK